MAAPSPRHALTIAFLWGMGWQLTALHWLPRAFYLDADRNWVAGIVGGIPALIVVAAYGALIPLLAASLSRMATPVTRPLVFASVWLGLEIIKSLHPMGFPWLPLGMTLVAGDALPQFASLAGVYGLSAVVLGVAILVSTTSATRLRIAACVMLALYGFGVWRLQPVTVDIPPGPPIRLVQPNMQEPHRWDVERRISYLEDALTLAFTPSSTIPPLAVFFPETGIPFYLDEQTDIRDWVRHSLQPHQQIITGAVRRDIASDGQPAAFYNSLTALTADGHFTGWYDKQLLVPFGEYIPLRTWVEPWLPAPIRSFTRQRLDFGHGQQSPLLATSAGMALGLICYEGIFPTYVARHAHGARYLLNITNDNWFAGTIALSQHAALERIRAIETGLPLVRVANTGLTLVTDAYGRTIGHLKPNTATTLDISLPPALDFPTPYMHLFH